MSASRLYAPPSARASRPRGGGPHPRSRPEPDRRAWGRKAKIKGLTIKAIERDSFTTVIREAAAAGTYDHILIDLAGAREATVLKAIARSGLVVIPAQASEPDLREALVVVSDIKDVAEEKGAPIPYRLLLTKMPSLRTRVTDFAYQELARTVCRSSGPSWSNASLTVKCS